MRILRQGSMKMHSAWQTALRPGPAGDLEGYRARGKPLAGEALHDVEEQLGRDDLDNHRLT
jgi:hypothetical protein